jgi:hypothetical protein
MNICTGCDWRATADAGSLADQHARHVAAILADRLAPLLAELRDAREALVSVESERDRWTQEALEYREDYARNRAERDEARAERDALRERIDHWCVEWSVSFPGLAEHLRAALADPEAS